MEINNYIALAGEQATYHFIEWYDKENGGFEYTYDKITFSDDGEQVSRKQYQCFNKEQWTEKLLKFAKLATEF